VIKIYIEGAESTGKSTLAEHLAHYFGGRFLPEYGRIYLQQHWGKINYSDIETIAEMQVSLEKLHAADYKGVMFIDVSLINTKHWFLHSFHKYPMWMDFEINQYKENCFLLCEPDIPWIADGVRQNDGDMRLELHEKYRQTLLSNTISFFTVSGSIEKREKVAIDYVSAYLQSIKVFS
jgi:nicotinamide riboside kinase